jgi:hypothetical protein
MARPPAGELPPSPLSSPYSPHFILPLQAPPPSLRDILAAYKSRGDGDRDMLIAMLNAKSAEDQVCFSPNRHNRSIPIHLSLAPRKRRSSP